MNTSLICLVVGLFCVGQVFADPARLFGIRVVDESTGRGVPLVEMKTTGEISYITDSAGWIAFDEPGLMDRDVWFTINSHGYEYPADGFGFRGVRLKTSPGAVAEVKVKRTIIAERLYRLTGGGIYRDSLLLGRPVPLQQPIIDGDLMGCDSILSAIHRGKIYWFWGDTNRVTYPLGNFRVTAATSSLPAEGGLAPSVGVDYDYFMGTDGFVRQMVPRTDEGPVWLSGLGTVRDPQGTDRIVAHYSRMKSLEVRLERGLVVLNDETGAFETICQIDLDAPLSPDGHPTKVVVEGVHYIYYNFPYPNIRVRDDWASVIDVSTYEAFTPLVQGTTRLNAESPQLDRDEQGRLNWSWKRATAYVGTREINGMIAHGQLKPDEVPFRPVDVDTGKPITIAGGSFYWNDHAKRYVMIGLEHLGTSVLGEIWYAESDKLEGPWTRAIKVASHQMQDLYNPKQHPFFDEQGGRLIYFEGTFTNGFSGSKLKTPRYDYNQLMYRLDLEEPRMIEFRKGMR
jgi:hypothetical protein